MLHHARPNHHRLVAKRVERARRTIEGYFAAEIRELCASIEATRRTREGLAGSPAIAAAFALLEKDQAPRNSREHRMAVEAIEHLNMLGERIARLHLHVDELRASLVAQESTLDAIWERYVQGG